VALSFAIYILKGIFKAKRRIMETQVFHHAKNIIFPKKKSSKRNPKSFKILL
jgi:hypothetical protein